MSRKAFKSPLSKRERAFSFAERITALDLAGAGMSACAGAQSSFA